MRTCNGTSVENYANITLFVFFNGTEIMTPFPRLTNNSVPSDESWTAINNSSNLLVDLDLLFHSFSWQWVLKG